MSIIIDCPCGKRLDVPEDAAGRRARCRTCGRVHRVPSQPKPDTKAPRPWRSWVLQWRPPFGVWTYMTAALAWAALASVLFINKTFEVPQVREARESALQAATQDRDALERKSQLSITAALKERDDAVTESQRASVAAKDARDRAARAEKQVEEARRKLAAASGELAVQVLERAKLHDQIVSRSRDSDNKSEPVPVRGTEVTLRSRGTRVFIVTDAGWDEFERARAASDDIGMGVLIVQRKVFLVKVGTRAKVIDTGLFTVKVRILEGDHFGAAGWIDREFVHVAN